MEVRVDPLVCGYVSRRGGALWVRSTRQRCCSGSTTWLRATTRRPRDTERYTPLDCQLPITVFFQAAAGEPHELEVELRGLLFRRPTALWDGCMVKL
ncbi:MAG: hypothetical protein M0Z95_01230 [Actinomycetota bacterium]|nr:hypothetical protein [Actinomycetota bacterium]